MCCNVSEDFVTFVVVYAVHMGKDLRAVTLDFLERRMRNFSYCSMLKMRFGMALVSRRTLA